MNNLFNNVLGYALDNEQKACVLDNSQYLLIVAGAGSGKTLTMIGKVLYLTQIENIKAKQILCISFTNETTKSFINKLQSANIDGVDVFTFHKLALNILRKNNTNTFLAQPDTLEYIIEEYLEHIIINSNTYMSIVLKYFKINPLFNIKKKYLKLINTNSFNNLKKLIAKFIHLAKSHNWQIQDMISLYQKQIIFTNNHYFMKITILIYLWYQHELESSNTLDFDDLLIKASEVVNKNHIKLPYRYILIDEFQDTSPIRLKLIQTIIKYNKAKLIVVGDDWQSIYRFTGCNLDIFLNFKQYFKGAKVLKIENTYRNSQQLINIAGSFIMQNKKQLTKNLKSQLELYRPITIVFYKNNIKQSFTKILDILYKEHKFPLLILGRNNNDIYYYLDKRFSIDNDNKITDNKHYDFDIRYLTAHKAKGLECEYVIIINLINSLIGFPNQLKNEQIITNIIPDKKLFPFEEERRLFYVALTRTKKEVFLFSPQNNHSIFIKELKNNYSKQINIKKV